MNERAGTAFRRSKSCVGYRNVPEAVARSVVIALLMTVISACAVEELQSGVVVAAVPELSLEAGTVVSFGPLNERDRTYPIVTDGKSGSLAVPAGIIRPFDTHVAAEEFVRESEGVLGRTAQAAVNALRVRAAPHTDSEVLYRLRLDEEVTLVSVASPETAIGGRSGVWVEVVAGGAYRGYVFSPLLQDLPSSITSSAGGGTAGGPGASSVPLDDIKTVIAGNVWWSTATAEAYRRGNPVLEAFRLSNGTFSMKSGDRSWSLPITEATVLYPRFTFDDEGIGLTIRDAETIDLILESDETSLRDTFIPAESHSWSEINSLYRRRRDFSTALEGYTGLYRSDTYGELTIHDAATLSWEGGDILTPLGITGGGVRHRRISYAPVPVSGAATTVDGGITLSYPGGPAFLVDLQDEAIRLVWLPDFDRESPFVATVPVSPLVMYFSRESGSSLPPSDATILE